MLKITKKDFDKIPNDYKSIYSSDYLHGTNYDGKRTFIKWIEGIGTCLLIESIDFEIIETQCIN